MWYDNMAVPVDFKLLTQAIWRADALALFKAGSSIAARIAMIAITTNNSMRVKCFFIFPFLFRFVSKDNSSNLRKIQFLCPENNSSTAERYGEA